MPTAKLQSAPATAVIDQNNVLTLSWQPLPDANGGFTQYSGWDISIDDPNPHTGTIFVAAGTIPPVAQSFLRVLSAGDHTLTMKAVSASNSPAFDSDWWDGPVSPDTVRDFPGVLGPTDVTLDNTTLLLGQQLNVTLNPVYTTANQWQVIWPDGTNTGWLPPTASVVAKAFTTPGPQTVVVQSRFDYTGAQYDPPTTLVRSLAIPIFVMDQQVATNNAANQGLSTTLGFGGTEGFELIDTSVAAVTPEPWEAIARGIVRDTNTNELKMVIAATRFQGGSSLLGTLAMDVYPIEGRPHSKELIEPVFQLITGSNTTAVPVKIQTTTLPDLIVGKSINEALGGTLAMTVKSNTGIPDFLWTATNLPPGVFLGTNGVFSGTPLQLGLFNITFAVQDSGSPFSIDEVTLPVTVKTDMKVIIAAGQKDANNTTLVQTGTTLGVAQVNKPYSVQMQVGNINPNVATAGGLAPYKWSIPAGALPVGLTIDPNTGLISGVPSTYNSTTDFAKTFTAVVQVTDAIGAKASATYTMTLEPAALTVGDADQNTIFATQDFKLAIPVFGGTSPYTLVIFAPASGESSFYLSHALVDGQIEVVLNVPASALGNHSFLVQVQDQVPTVVTKTITYNVKAATAISQLVKALVDHYWFHGDSGTATPVDVVGTGFGGFVLASDTVIPANGIRVTVDPTLGTEGQATFSPNWSAAISYSPGDHVLSGGVYYSCILANTNQAPPNVTFWQVALPTFANSEVRTPLILDWAEQEFGRISRTYSLLTHDNANANDIGNISTIAHPFVNGDVVGMNPRKPYFNSPATVVNGQPDLAGLLYTARIFPLTTLPPGLSLDANTGLIYGTLAGAPPSTTQVQYVDNAGTLHGTATINWQPTSANQFSPTNTFVDGSLGTTYDADASPLAQIAPPGGVTLASISPFTTMPKGLQTKINGAGNAVVYGTPTEAGYFDLWYQVQSVSGQSCFVHQRLAVYDPLPFLIVSSSLPNIGAGPYKHFDNTAVTLYAAGGVASGAGQYSWGASDTVNGPWAVSGGNAAPTSGPFLGLTLNVATGILSGTLTSPPGGSGFTDLGQITFSVTDTRTVVNALFPNTPQNAFATVTRAIDITYTGSLIITNPNPVGLATFVGFALTQVQQNTPIAGQATYHLSANLANPSNYVGKAFTFSGFVQPGNNVSGVVLAATGGVGTSTLVISNGTAINETHAGIAGLEYGWFLKGAGGNAATYAWSITAGGLPAGISLNTSTGEITGALTTLTPVNPTVTFGLTDTVLTATPVLFNVAVGVETVLVTTGRTRVAGASPLTIDSVNIGTPYLGALLSTVTHTTNAAWQQAPTSSHPRLLQTDIPGLRIMSDINSNSDDNGETGTIAGLYTAASFSGHLIRVVVVDAAGNTGSTILNMNTGSTLAITDSSPLPNATATISYSYTFHGIGGLTPYNWQIDPSTTGFINSSSFAFGGNTFTLNSSSGQLTSTVSGSAATDANVVIKLTDAAASSTTATFSLTVQPFGLVINGPFTMTASSGRAFTRSLTVSGVPGTDTIKWTVSGGALPTGLSLNFDTGVVSGTTNVSGFNQTVTIRATDTTLGSYKDQPFTVTVNAGLTLQTGIDAINSLSTNSMGFIDNGSVSAINPRPNQSFIVLASGVVSTTPGAITITTSNPNITATVTTLDTVNQIATITLTGSAFDVGVPGTYSLAITVVDSGVTVSGTFTWTVYDDGILRIAPGSGNFPTQLISGQ